VGPAADATDAALRLISFDRVMEHRWNEIISATLSTTNRTWTDLGSNPGLRDERSATNRLSHGTVTGTALLYNAIDACQGHG
jgi:hypothetical protein